MVLLRRAVCCAALLLGAPQAQPEAQAQAGTAGASLVGVSVRVRLEESGVARVTARYDVRIEVADTVVLGAVPFFGLEIAEPEATAGGVPVPAVRGRAGGAIDVRVPIGSGATVLEVTYTVPAAAVAKGAVVDVRVPLLLPRAVPVSSREDFFRVELLATPGTHVVESFPTVARAGGGAGVTHAMVLPVAPGLLRWQLTTGAPPRVTFATAVDTGVVLLLLVMAVLGVRALRRPVREP